MKDLLNDALSLLSDSHIEEAATYTSETKTIRLSKIIPLAACLVLIIVSAFAIKEYLSPHITPTQITPTHTTVFCDYHTTTIGGVIPPENNSTTVAGVTDDSTTVAHAPEGTSTTMPTTSSAGVTEIPEIRLHCTTPATDYTGWEKHSFTSYYHQINIDEASYIAEQPLSSTDEPLSEERIGKLLYEFIWSDYRFKVDGNGDFTVEVYEIIGYSQAEAVAVGRKDGLMKGYYAYYSQKGYLREVLSNSQTLSDVISFAGIDITASHNPENFCTSYWTYYKENGKEDITYSICIYTMEQLASLIIESRDAEAEYRTSTTGEKLTFNAYLKEYPCEIYLCKDGYLYFYADGLTRAFNIGVENYEKFINTFSHVVWTPENPVTMG